ncbi:hypothetical protein [Nocardia sp. BMG51109]|uniref:hypothetical protein n=1 Tax=Nocardia sp. BMG51109 TaxID=1056816 RepID=UPI0012ECB006
MASPYLLLLLGPSGAGKTTVKDHLVTKAGYDTAQKYTTREHRGTVEDTRDFIFCTADEIPDSGVLRFTSYGAVFGIRLTAIEDSLRRGRCHVLTVGDCSSVESLRNIFPGRVATLFLYCDRHVLKSRIAADPHRASRWPTVQEEVESIYSTISCIDHVIDCSSPFARTVLHLNTLIETIDRTFEEPL